MITISIASPQVFVSLFDCLAGVYFKDIVLAMMYQWERRFFFASDA